MNGGGCEKGNFVLSTTGVFSGLVVVLVMGFFLCRSLWGWRESCPATFMTAVGERLTAGLMLLLLQLDAGGSGKRGVKGVVLQLK